MPRFAVVEASQASRNRAFSPAVCSLLGTSVPGAEALAHSQEAQLADTAEPASVFADGPAERDVVAAQSFGVVP